jgi:CheY-like chemotaxis protein
MSEPGKHPSTSFASINILVVDDKPANLQAFESVIRPLGYTPYLADSGKMALELAALYRFAVILLDVRMPLMSGAETAVQLRKTTYGRTTPIIFVSAHEDSHLEVSRSGVEGFVAFLFSPVNPEVLTWKLQSWVEVSLRLHMYRRQTVKVREAQEELEKLLGKRPLPEAALRQANARLATAVRLLTQSVAD